MRRAMGKRRAPCPAPNATVASRMVDVALLGVAAACFAFAGERSADLEERVPIFVFVSLIKYLWGFMRHVILFVTDIDVRVTK